MLRLSLWKAIHSGTRAIVEWNMIAQWFPPFAAKQHTFRLLNGTLTLNNRRHFPMFWHIGECSKSTHLRRDSDSVQAFSPYRRRASTRKQHELKKLGEILGSSFEKVQFSTTPWKKFVPKSERDKTIKWNPPLQQGSRNEAPKHVKIEYVSLKLAGA